MTSRKKTASESEGTTGKKAASSAKKPSTSRKPKSTTQEKPPLAEIAELTTDQEDQPESGAITLTEGAVGDPEPATEPAAHDWVDIMVAFFIGGQRYGLPVASVQEIQQIVAFSEVPTQGGSVAGMVNLRGAVIPAVDMRLLLGMPKVEYTLETPMIICRRRGRLIALIVDEVQDVVLLPEGCLQAAPAMHALSEKMIGVCRFENDLVYLLDVERLLAPLDHLG